ncbi:GNAT family N-acetyltransferase [Gracilibacillus salinarum]|uniref:GNAT family N-acetyltransferase n=1 Tax=Gracilibacillus salinarum TaxID=2932255 RepID=A0ABY4GHP2_9BACI|nr:GNAT family N-acetyltransferase [Gracilibacillus salinarum]UOQ83718.1 GNAT family N-acetyltransferase [Gracilibacillus salinarum]
MTKYLEPTPWDKRNFHIDTFQLKEYSEAALAETDKTEGHFTIKVDPFADTANLKKYGFYYADTLIEPIGKKDKLKQVDQENIQFTHNFHREDILDIAEEAFTGGRFHRDFNIPNHMADTRYRNWVNDLIDKDLILALELHSSMAGFFAYQNDQILLLAMHRDYRGKGLATAFASSCVQEQFRLTGHDTLRTSISPTNPASLNVFISLGFRLNGAVDVYHKLNGTLADGG